MGRVLQPVPACGHPPGPTPRFCWACHRKGLLEAGWLVHDATTLERARVLAMRKTSGAPGYQAAVA